MLNKMINDLQELLEKLKLLDETLYELSLECVKALNDDRKIIFAGNGVQPLTANIWQQS